MKLLSFIHDGKQKLGIKINEGIIDVEASINNKMEGMIPTSIMDVIEGGPSALSLLNNHIDALDLTNSSYFVNENEIVWGPSVPEPNKIICIGLNYAKHADEAKQPYPEEPIIFSKWNNSLTGHQCDIEIPQRAKLMDYEAELAIVIGKKAKNISKEQALDYVFGYTVSNDVSARDLQFRSSQWMLGKTSDGFCPIGPYLVSSDEVGNPNSLNIRLYVNGEMRQNSNTEDLIFHCEDLVSYASQFMTLVPGDIILTGTPEGVILGYPEEQRVFLKSGDVMTVEIEKLGSLTNRLI